MAPHSSPRRLEGAGDAELLRMTRTGDMDAYALLFHRHASAAASVARSVTSSYEPDDLVSEAYVRILQALQSGNGPKDTFRPYLFTTVRNIAASWGRAGKDAVPLGPEELETLAVQEDHSLVALDRSLTAQAFRSLPPRWQEALWYSEIEGMQPAELAPILGMSAQAAAALCYRAREGLRQAWIRAHLTSADLEPECAWTVEHLPARSRGRLGKRDRARVEAHLETCEKCTMAAAEAEETGARLALVLLPLFLGTGAATIYAATLKGGAATGSAAGTVGAGTTAGSAGGAGAAGGSAAAGTGAAGASTSAGTVTAAASAAGSTTVAAGATAGGLGALFSGASGVILGVAASMVIVGGAVAGVLIATSPGRGADASPVAIADGSSGASHGGASSVQGSTPRPTPTSPSTPTMPSGGSSDDDTPGSDAAEHNAPPAASGRPGGSSGTAPGGSTGSTGPTQPGGPTGPTDPTGPGGPSDPVPPAAPSIANVDTGGGLYYPIVSGTAAPGATITVTAGGTMATTTADATGAWSASPFDAERHQTAASLKALSAATATTDQSDSSDPSDQTDQSDASDQSDPSDLGVLAPPVIAAPVTVSGTIEITQTVAGVQSEAASASYSVTGPQLSVEQLLGDELPVVSVYVPGADGAFREILIDGAQQQPVISIGEYSFFVLGVGTHTISARYDDGSGRLGPSSQVAITVGPTRPAA